MSAPELAPRGAFGGILAVWIAAVVVSAAIGFFAPIDWRMAWMSVGLGGCILLTFLLQLFVGTSKGFIDRVALSVAGALLIMGVVSAAFGLTALLPGSILPR
jgi:hypothetical protein